MKIACFTDIPSVLSICCWFSDTMNFTASPVKAFQKTSQPCSSWHGLRILLNPSSHGIDPRKQAILTAFRHRSGRRHQILLQATWLAYPSIFLLSHATISCHVVGLALSHAYHFNTRTSTNGTNDILSQVSKIKCDKHQTAAHLWQLDRGGRRIGLQV